MIRVLLVPIGAKPVITEVDGESLEALTGLIDGGDLDAVEAGPGVMLFCDKERGRKRLAYNFDYAGEPVMGPAFFARQDGSDLVSLDEDDVRGIKMFLGRHLTR